MIDPEEINPFTLPFVTLVNYKDIPHMPGIYFVVSRFDFLYIGIATDFRVRWQKHHKYKDLEVYSNPVIYYHVMRGKSAVRKAEQGLIKKFKPLLNDAFNPFSQKLDGITERFDDELKRMDLYLAKESFRRYKG